MSFSGTIGRSPVNRPPPRRTVLILVEGQSVSARPVRSGRLSCPGRGGGNEEGSTSSAALCGEGARAPSPVPTPPGRCPPRSPVRVSRGTVWIRYQPHRYVAPWNTFAPMGASPLPVSPTPPGRFPPRSPVRVSRGTVQIRHPAPGFIRSGFQAIDRDSAKVETLRYHHECTAPMIRSRQWARLLCPKVGPPAGYPPRSRGNGPGSLLHPVRLPSKVQARGQRPTNACRGGIYSPAG